MAKARRVPGLLIQLLSSGYQVEQNSNGTLRKISSALDCVDWRVFHGFGGLTAIWKDPGLKPRFWEVVGRGLKPAATPEKQK